MTEMSNIFYLARRDARFGKVAMTSMAGTGARETSGTWPGEPELSTGSQRDHYYDEVVHRLFVLSRLPQNWDGYGALPLDIDTALYALTLLSTLHQPGTTLPFIAPLAHGGLQFEWNTPAVAVEVEVLKPLQVSILVEDRETGEMEERNFAGSSTDRQVASIMKGLEGKLRDRQDRPAEQRRA